MFLIIRLIFMVVAIFVGLTLMTGVSLWLRVRQHLQNPFLKPDKNPPPPAGKGDIIEGEYEVLDDPK